jgi:hypothetical protein
MTINSFYCCGRLASVSVEFLPGPKASVDQGKRDNCCDYASRFVKVHDAQQPSVSDIVLHAPVLPCFAALTVACLPAVSGDRYKNTCSLSWLHSPPLPGDRDACVMYCAFLI